MKTINYYLLSTVMVMGTYLALNASDDVMAPMVATAERPAQEISQEASAYMPAEEPTYEMQESFQISVPEDMSSPLVEEEYSDYSYQEQPSESENFSEFFQEQE